MPNHRTRNNKYTGRFKSHTDINNYNNFLLELDKKQRESKDSNNNYLEKKQPHVVLGKK
jgi:hypothetical protein